jgi:osmotically-inducible protein OsmY
MAGVKLEGEVEWQYQKEAAESAVRYLTGMTGVSNLITIKPRVFPTELRSKIEDAFKRSAELDARRISVEVDGGKGDPARQRALVG